jgi:hypothetical protein
MAPSLSLTGLCPPLAFHGQSGLIDAPHMVNACIHSKSCDFLEPGMSQDGDSEWERGYRRYMDLFVWTVKFLYQCQS